MLLTSQPEVAADFVSVLMSEEVRQRYNCVIQPQKSVTNIPDHPSDIHSSGIHHSDNSYIEYNELSFYCAIGL